jgi:WD40-like Beta Propeller Repeat
LRIGYKYATPNGLHGAGALRLADRMLAALVLLVVALLAAAAPAHSSFPGANGRLAFSAETLGYNQHAVLWDYTRATRQLRQLTERGPTCEPGSIPSAADNWADGGLDYSPDGRWIAYLHADDCPGAESREGLWIMRANGTDQRRLAHIGLYVTGVVTGLEAAFSPDGRSIAVVHDTATTSGVHALTVFSTTDGTVQRQAVFGRRFSPGGLDWGTNGRLVVSLDGSLYVMSPGGGGRHRFRVRPIGDWEHDGPDWSPSAHSIAFRGTRWFGEDHSDSESIWRRFVGRATGVRLTRGGLPWSPTFAPNGRRIAFATRTGIVSIPSRGGGAVRTILRGGGPIQSVFSVSWQPLPRAALARHRAESLP